eukprot:162452-Chlamydomonas_euryale.AAC.8
MSRRACHGPLRGGVVGTGACSDPCKSDRVKAQSWTWTTCCHLVFAAPGNTRPDHYDPSSRAAPTHFISAKLGLCRSQPDNRCALSCRTAAALKTGGLGAFAALSFGPQFGLSFDGRNRDGRLRAVLASSRPQRWTRRRAGSAAREEQIRWKWMAEGTGASGLRARRWMSQKDPARWHGILGDASAFCIGRRGGRPSRRASSNSTVVGRFCPRLRGNRLRFCQSATTNAPPPRDPEVVAAAAGGRRVSNPNSCTATAERLRNEGERALANPRSDATKPTLLESGAIQTVKVGWAVRRIIREMLAADAWRAHEPRRVLEIRQSDVQLRAAVQTTMQLLTAGPP